MTKRFAIVCMLVALVGLLALPAATAAAPAKTAKGKITAIEGTRVTIALEGERPDWVRKNGFVKFAVGTGKIILVSAADTTPFTIVVNLKKAASLQVGEVVTFEKGLAVSGC